MKLNTGQAWSDATTLLRANRDAVIAVAGLFLFLPYFALALFVPEAVNPAPVEAPPGTPPDVAMEAMLDAMGRQYADNWPYFLLATLAQFVGTLGLLALLTDRGRPTVAEALMTGLRAVLSYIVAQILVVFSVGLVVGLPVALLSAISPAVGALAGLLLMILAVYIFVKFSLVSPVIAVEGELNPINALRRSWQLTKGNSLRIFAFFVLLIIAIGIVSVLFTLVLGTVFAAVGGSIASIGTGIVTSLVNAVIGVIFLGVLAAVHQQLAGPSSETISDAFE